MSKNVKSKENPTFEEALKRLEEIVDTLEAGSVPLDESIKLYEEGMTLAKSCMTQLSEAKLKLKKIQKNFGGTLDETDIEL
ncbi:MAG: exodeoxyribonuclease VII small subunit [Bacteroidetes bacterium]|nr:exodeoxyribonuclease VII small subunit [Bacteroidota bacterium]MCL5737527.1 exodeoxyribonuclease VII small subunit [Bacteroidota bacterium]